MGDFILEPVCEKQDFQYRVKNQKDVYVVIGEESNGRVSYASSAAKEKIKKNVELTFIKREFFEDVCIDHMVLTAEEFQKKILHPIKQ